MISRFAGTVASGAARTTVFLNAGRNFDTGSVRRRRPSSTRIMAATLVTAFDIEAIRKIVSFSIERPFSTSRLPTASK